MNAVTLLEAAEKAPRAVGITIAIVFGALVLVIVVGLVVYIGRWKQVRGATSRYDAFRRAFGEKGAKRIFIGNVVLAGLCLVLFVVYRSQNWR